MLSAVWGTAPSTVKLAVTTLEKLGMIVVEDDGAMRITNWGRYQSVKSYEEVQQQWKERKQIQRHRERVEDVTGQSRDSHGTDCDMSRDVLPQEREVEQEVESEQEERNRTEEREEETVALWKSEPDLCETAWKTFEKYYGTFMPNNTKEIDAINKLIAMSAKRGDVEIILPAMMKKLQEMKEDDNSKNGFWKKKPFLPSTLVSLWSQVWEEAKVEAGDSLETEDIPDVGF